MADQVNKDGSSSDDDSISLLHNLYVCRDKRIDEAVTRTDFSSPFADKDMTKEKQTTECVASSPSVKVSRPLMSLRRLHKRDATGETLLHKACKRRDLARVQALIQAGLNVNMKDYAGWTALHEACVVGEEAVVEALLKAGANVNAWGIHGVTPLHDAVGAGHYQVVMLLLRSGAVVDIRNLAGLTAVDMAEEDDMKELLQTFQTGATSSELHCDTPQNGGDAANLQPREANDSEEAGEPRRKDAFPDTWRHCEAVKSVSEDVGKKLSEVSAWSLTDLTVGDRYLAALRQTHDMLTEVLRKQRREKDRLSQKHHRSRGDGRQQPVLRLQLLSLASRQRDLVELLCRQQRLVQKYTAMRAPPSTQPPHHPGDVLEERPHTKKQRKTGTAGTARSRSKVKGQRAALSSLVQRGVTPAGSLLQVQLKDQWHRARVQADGSIQSAGKVHRTLELWLQAILGKNIPVSSSYAWDKVKFQNKPLSCHLEKMEGEGQEEEQTAGEACLLQTAAVSNRHQETAGTAARSSDWMKVQTICLVGDDGWLPNAVVDQFWDQLVYKDYLEEEDLNQLVYKDNLKEEDLNQLIYKNHLDEEDLNQLVYKDYLEEDDWNQLVYNLEQED